MSPGEFWVQTPRGLDLTFRAVAARRRREHEDQITAAWRLASLNNLALQGALPDLDALIGRSPKAREKTPQELEAALFTWMGPLPKRKG